MCLCLVLSACGRPKTFDASAVQIVHRTVYSGPRTALVEPGVVADELILFGRWLAGVRWQAAIAYAEAVPRPVVTVERQPTMIAASPVSSSGSVNGMPCGGALPSCCTLAAESGGNPTAVGSGTWFGLWQFADGTWAGYGGYQHASDAPASVQNERAAQVFAGGVGWGNWRGDGCYPGG